MLSGGPAPGFSQLTFGRRGPGAVPTGWICWPKAFPALVTLSTTDVSTSDPQWHCEQLTVENTLALQVKGLYYLSKVLVWLGL